MTLGEFATIVGAAPRWVQNARAILSSRRRYSAQEAKVLGLARVVAEATGMPLARSRGLAKEALAAWPKSKEWVQENVDASVRIVVDVERYLSAFATRLSLSRNYYAARRQGRPVLRVREPVRAATEYGWDVTLLHETIKRTPAERLKHLSETTQSLLTLRRARE